MTIVFIVSRWTRPSESSAAVVAYESSNCCSLYPAFPAGNVPTSRSGKIEVETVKSLSIRRQNASASTKILLHQPGNIFAVRPAWIELQLTPFAVGFVKCKSFFQYKRRGPSVDEDVVITQDKLMVIIAELK